MPCTCDKRDHLLARSNGWYTSLLYRCNSNFSYLLTPPLKTEWPFSSINTQHLEKTYECTKSKTFDTRDTPSHLNLSKALENKGRQYAMLFARSPGYQIGQYLSLPLALNEALQQQLRNKGMVRGTVSSQYRDILFALLLHRAIQKQRGSINNQQLQDYVLVLISAPY
ncbi:hypothetical protein BCR41DRAFT_403485 [Lobosporangium transversale]|uniref:Uncharacterized protein n=1 Tax=Lobosporangium transversale TaxID=64571 RepID=A0A1Y2G343_9FUNG|nr:hypothetical protein BCR41DRAFT_403485 [Lobosporangium transversale]ORY91809.1 hypothetical protein BCR41DRAFT_403485 [Lobosporangium transversale]|eukprot:XP_021875121.1 hypothetical protein BCR41DRAFT_403485 [Lobosporangium transversale]